MQKTKKSKLTPSNIPYCTHVWNPLAGCSKATEGCDSCWAVNMANRLQGVGIRGYDNVTKGNNWTGNINLIPEKLDAPLNTKKPSVIFVNSMSDLFHKFVSFDFIEKVFNVIKDCPQHKFIILTKRPERVREFWVTNLRHFSLFDYPNMYLGVSISSEKDLWMLDVLKQIPIDNKIISFEPLLGHIECDLTGIKWVIIGVESGKGMRYCDIVNVQDLVYQSLQLKIPVYVKQVHIWKNGEFKLVKDLNEFPEFTNFQQLPFKL
jgi:protein gp37